MKKISLQEVEKSAAHSSAVKSLKSDKAKTNWTQLFVAHGKHIEAVREEPKILK